MLLLDGIVVGDKAQEREMVHLCNVCDKAFKYLQRLESFVTDIAEVTLSLSYALSPHTDPIQQQHDFLYKPALNTCRSRRQKMSTPLHVLLKADPLLEGDLADDKADPSVCVQLHQISVLQYFLETAGSMEHQHVLRQAVFF
jgi:hypothetical protein